MDRNVFVAVILFFLVVADVSDASLMWKLRSLVGMGPNDNLTSTHLSPSPSPVPDLKHLDPNAKDGAKLKGPEMPNKSSEVVPKGSNSTVPESPPPVINKPDEDKTDQEKKNDHKNDAQPMIGENCDGSPKSCILLNSLITCNRTLEDGSGEVVFLVQNKGESTQKVHLTVPNSVKFASEQLVIPQHQTKKINISRSINNSTTVILNAGKANCTFHLGPLLPEGNSFLRLPSYDKLVTPINGAYLLIFTVIMLGGSWACCKFRKKRWQGGVPYQELEMAVPETGSATIVESAEGWDQDWDDDWDEEKAVKSPVSRHVGNISANGLTARSSNKEGWENDWDD